MRLPSQLGRTLEDVKLAVRLLNEAWNASTRRLKHVWTRTKGKRIGGACAFQSNMLIMQRLERLSRLKTYAEPKLQYRVAGWKQVCGSCAAFCADQCACCCGDFERGQEVKTEEEGKGCGGGCGQWTTGRGWDIA
jgi:hypothetical protein